MTNPTDTNQASELFDLCRQVDCDRKHEARGYCSMHYKRLMRTGDPDIINPRRTKHGKSNTPEYFAWSAMVQCCTNPNNPQYKNYGGRDIKIDNRWMSFDNFVKDVGKRPTPRHEIDRIDNDGSYEPSNVHWATRKEQCNNLRKSVFIEYNGARLTVSQWADKLNIKRTTLDARLRRGWSVERALTYEQ